MKRVALIALTVLLGFAFLWGAGSLHQPILESRRVHQLDHGEPLENAPPVIVFSTIALGGFSGIIADILWVRAAQLQMEGQYVELVQLSDWITKLQPRFPEGWIYHAWNLAYNVSIMFPRQEDRWRWVRHGISLLRDGGLRYNPANPTLHRELGWLFQHKIGMSTDQAHMFYKFSWALEMERLFDGRGPDYDQLNRTPPGRAALLRIPGMVELVEQLREEGFDPFTYQWPESARLPRMLDILRDHPAGGVLLSHVRLRMMVDRYRLAPALMRQLESVMGPLDWRLPQAHAIYWAWNGIPHAEGWELQMLDRMVFHGMAEAFRAGRYFYDPDEELFMPGPYPELLPYTMHAFVKAIEDHLQPAMETAYLNFLNHGITVVYTYNRLQDAILVFDEIQTRFPDEIQGRTMEEYVVHRYIEQVADISEQEAHAFVQGSFYQSLYWAALGDPERAAGYDRLARATWQRYMAPRMDDPDWRERTGLPSLDHIRRQALDEVRRNVTSQAALQRLQAHEL